MAFSLIFLFLKNRKCFFIKSNYFQHFINDVNIENKISDPSFNLHPSPGFYKQILTFFLKNFASEGLLFESLRIKSDPPFEKFRVPGDVIGDDDPVFGTELFCIGFAEEFFLGG